MSIEQVRKYFRENNIKNEILEFESSSATVELAALALNVEGARIAKTLSFKVGDGCVLVVTAGDGKINNRKYKDYFKCKAKMLSMEEVVAFTGHMVGGVCPFGVGEDVKVYLDVSLKRFKTVFPACGSANSAVELTIAQLFEYSKAIDFIDVCNDIEG